MEKSITCPECQNGINLEQEIIVGDVVECPHCGSELRITGIDSEVTVELIEEEK